MLIRKKNYHSFFAVIESLHSMFKIRQMVNSETDILNSVLTDLLLRPPQKLPITHPFAYGSDPSEKPIYNLDYCSHCISLFSFSHLHQKKNVQLFFFSCAKHIPVSVKNIYSWLWKADLSKWVLGHFLSTTPSHRSTRLLPCAFGCSLSSPIFLSSHGWHVFGMIPHWPAFLIQRTAKTFFFIYLKHFRRVSYIIP